MAGNGYSRTYGLPIGPDCSDTGSLIQPCGRTAAAVLRPAYLRAVGLVEHGDAAEPPLGEPRAEAVRAARVGLAPKERLEGLPAGCAPLHVGATTRASSAHAEWRVRLMTGEAMCVWIIRPCIRREGLRV